MEKIELDLATGKIAALASGPIDAPIVLAFHGWLDNAASFIPLSFYLKDVRLIAFDFPGHGYSYHHPQGSYFHFVDYMPVIMNIIDHLELEQCNLLGHSLGAGVASMVAGTIPEKIKTLTLIDALGPLVSSVNKLPDLVRTAVYQYSQLGIKKPPFYETKAQAIEARLKASQMERSSVELLVERGIKQQDGGYVWRTDQRLLFKPLIMFTEEQVWPFLKQISAKTCLIRPNGGWPFGEELFETRTKLIQDLEIHRPDGNHHIHMDKPKLVASIISEFLTKNI